MRPSDALERALEAVSEPQGVVVEATSEAGRAVVELEDLDRLGARVRSVRVEPRAPAPLREQVAGVGSLRSLPDRLVPVEVDERLGGGVMRSDPRDMRGRRYFELGLDGQGGTVERYRSVERGGREREPFTLTREQLGRLVDELSEGLGEP